MSALPAAMARDLAWRADSDSTAVKIGARTKGPTPGLRGGSSAALAFLLQLGSENGPTRWHGRSGALLHSKLGSDAPPETPLVSAVGYAAVSSTEITSYTMKEGCFKSEKREDALASQNCQLPHSADTRREHIRNLSVGESFTWALYGFGVDVT